MICHNPLAHGIHQFPSILIFQFQMVGKTPEIVDDFLKLADIRAKIVPLKAREAEIRAAILSGECDRRGDQFMAVMRVAETVRIDTKACRFALGDELLEPWLRRGHTTYVLIRPKRRKSSK
jgi:hypothetical protein